MWTRWNTHTTIAADPADVIDALTCVDAIHGWSPVDFNLDDLAAQRLHGGTHARVVGKLAGFGVGFDVEVLEANCERLALLARGPVELDFSVWEVWGCLLTGGRLVARAVNTLLAAGVLDRALARIGAEAESASAELALAA